MESDIAFSRSRSRNAGTAVSCNAGISVSRKAATSVSPGRLALGQGTIGAPQAPAGRNS
jgi:hypothetical protein